MRDRAKAATENAARCPKCRREISPESFDCSYCGAPVALIWEDCRVVCYFLRLAAVFLLTSLIAGLIAVLVTDTLGLTGLGISNLAIISVIIAVIAIALWKLGDALDPPPNPHPAVPDELLRVTPRPPNSAGHNGGRNADSPGLKSG